MHFKPLLQPPESARRQKRYFFLIQRDCLVLTKDNQLPTAFELKELGIPETVLVYLGTLDGVGCLGGGIADVTVLPSQLHCVSLRDTFALFGEEFFRMAGFARSIIDWNRNFAFCGRCGHATRDAEGERAKVCPVCGLISYPRISPAIIVAITDSTRILLARSQRFRIPDMYSVLAGFVEPGESLEACVKREVLEEVGIPVEQVTYFGSQPWPFPDSLMIGFTARYAGGEITVDTRELVEAHWFEFDALPRIAEPPSIARKLIDSFIAAQAGRDSP